MRKKLAQMVDIIWTTLVMAASYLIGWISLPTITSLSEQIYIDSPALNWLYLRYQDNTEVYIIIIVFVSFLISYLLYRILRHTIQSKYSNIYKKKEIQKVYTDFVADAKELYIIGGDLDFLYEAKKQFEKVKKIGKNCNVLCGKSDNIKTKKLYKDLLDSGVNLKVYSRYADESLKEIRGQIKVNATGDQECLFVNRKEVKKEINYEVVRMQNKYFVDVMKHSFNRTFDKAQNSMIKLICFDMGGVYFDGDFNRDFLKTINKKLSVNIGTNHNHRLILDEKLNLGEKTIVSWVEESIDSILSGNERKFIERTWQSVWKPNEKMKMIAKELKNEGYEIGVFSNMDKLNGDMYKERGDFNIFATQYLFLSYEMGITKPADRFYQQILDQTGLQPYEILLIDDHEKNIKQAKQMGFQTIHFSIQNGLGDLIDKLQKKNIMLSNRIVKECQ